MVPTSIAHKKTVSLFMVFVLLYIQYVGMCGGIKVVFS